VLADNLYKKDKLNKRNLRLMVHKRQKLLTYLRRRERAGPRWRSLVENLGIQDAMWKGEISL
jgi:ribosomal protein S15P/S13E